MIKKENFSIKLKDLFPDLESLMFKNKSAQNLSKKKKHFKNKKYSATSLGGEPFTDKDK